MQEQGLADPPFHLQKTAAGYMIGDAETIMQNLSKDANSNFVPIL